jgi:hypothetical protein
VRYPAHLVCAWIGNSERIAVQHYLQAAEDHFQRAGGSAAKSGAGDPETAVRNRARQAAAPSRTTPFDEQKTPMESGFLLFSASACENLRDEPMTLTGFEPVSRP